MQTNNKTLLHRFILEKFQQYIEPSREGTPRGEPIGFSEVKYTATLYSLFNTKQKEIADRLKISHGLLRKWNTEEPFKVMVNMHCREFAEMFIKNMRDRVKQREALVNAYRTQSLHEIASHELPSLDYSEYSDAKDYSQKLFEHIVEGINKEHDKAISEFDVTMRLEIYSTFDAMRIYSGIKKNPKIAEKEKGIRNKILKSLIEDGNEIILKPNLDEEGKKDLLIILKNIARSLE